VDTTTRARERKKMQFRISGDPWSTTLGLRLRLLGLVMILAATSCGAGPVEEGEEAYLRGTRGPYRGRVIDAQTKGPIAGVVVAAWHYDVPALVQTNTKFHDAVEVLTDAQGHFVVDAPDIERRAPTRTTFPVFTVFKPGYTYFQGWFAPPEEMAERRNRSLLGVVQLQRVTGQSRQQRLRNFPPDLRASDVPGEKIPQYLKALAEERASLPE
jgi:hypothetical protein